MYEYRGYTFTVIVMQHEIKRWRILATPTDGILIYPLQGQRDYLTTLEAYTAARAWIDRQFIGSN